MTELELRYQMAELERSQMTELERRYQMGALNRSQMAALKRMYQKRLRDLDDVLAEMQN